MFDKSQIRKGKWSDPRIHIHSQDAGEKNGNETQYRIDLTYAKGKGIYFYINQYEIQRCDGYSTETYEPYMGIRGCVKVIDRYSDKQLLEVANKFTEEDCAIICEHYSKVVGPVSSGQEASQLTFNKVCEVVER